MARKGRKGFVAIPIDGTLSLSTLGNDTVLTVDVFGGNLTEDFYAISADLSSQIIALTAGEGDPTQCGWAHGDYSVTEIKEGLEVELLGPGNKIQQEQSRRLIRRIGMFVGNFLGTHVVMKLQGRSGEAMVRTKLKFVINSGKSLNLWVHNKSGSALTTGASLRFSGTVYGRWLI